MTHKILKHIPNSIFKLHKEIIPILGSGSYVYTSKGTQYLDYTSGIGALSTGHSHPQVIMEVKHQLNKLVHAPQQVFGTHESQINLTEKLIDIMPSNNLNSVFYTNSGSEATDNAIKIARRATNKSNIIAINGGFHGRTLGAMAVSSSNVKSKLLSQPLIPGVFFCDPNKDDFNKLLAYQTAPEETAAVILEPVQGECGIKNIDYNFLQFLKLECSKNNILLIADEVQCGFGRTGSYWNIKQKSVTADILTFGKGIASGFPLAGVVANNDLMDRLNPGYLGGTYGCNAIAAAAASATIDVFKKDNILSNVIEMSEIFSKNLCLLQQKHKSIKDVRVFGLMIAIEFNNNELAQLIVNELRDNYFILALLAGNTSQYLRLLPPLTTTKKEVNTFLEVFGEILSNIENIESKKLNTRTID